MRDYKETENRCEPRGMQLGHTGKETEKEMRKTKMIRKKTKIEKKGEIT